MKTLGICIPTYKRPDFLRRCVLSAVASAEGHPIRVFVADDSTNDTNQAVLEELCASYPFVHVHRNPVNLGIDDNIQQAVELCDSDYAWLIGEDDTFLPGAIARMHDRLQSIDVPFVFANYALVDDDPEHRLGAALDGVADGSIAAELFLSRHLWAAGFLGACIVRRPTWAKTDAAPYKGTYFTHVGRISEMVVDANEAFIVADCCVANRVEGEDNFTWKRDSYGVFFGFLSMCRAVAARRPAMEATMQMAAKAMERRYGWLSLRVAARLRSDHAYDYSQYRKYLRDCGLSGLKRMALLTISVTPPATLRPLVRVYRACRKPA